MQKHIRLLILVFLSCQLPIQGQDFLNRLAKKASSKLENKLEKETDKAIEDSINEENEKKDTKNEDNDKSKKEDVKNETKTNTDQASSKDEQASNKQMMEAMKNLGFSSTPAKYDDTYTFFASFTITIKSFKASGKKESDGTIISYINPNASTFAYRFKSGEIKGDDTKQEGIIISDIENKSTIILSEKEDEKTAMIYGSEILTDENYDENNQEIDEVENYSFTKTGQTKSILGYKCEEYKINDTQTKGTAWITKDFKWGSNFDGSPIFSATYISYKEVNGFLMESETTDLESGEHFTYNVIEIKPKTNIQFNLSDYEVTNVGSFKQPAEK